MRTWHKVTLCRIAFQRATFIREARQPGKAKLQWLKPPPSSMDGTTEVVPFHNRLGIDTTEADLFADSRALPRPRLEFGQAEG